MSNCQATELGTINVGKVKITVATDSAGTQIILLGKNLHLISQSFDTHEEACKAAEEIKQNGINFLKWNSPINTFFKFACVCAGAQPFN